MRTDKVVIVSGVAGGIGRATALRLASDGWAVVLTDIDEKGLDERAALVADNGGLSTTVCGDITAASTAVGLVSSALVEFGQLDAVVNNAGTALSKPLLDHTAEDFELAFRTNVLSAFLTTQNAIPAMLESGGGVIVNIGSISGDLARANLGAYGASKAALASLTRSIAMEHAPHIRCNTICPGGVETPMARAKFATYGSREAALVELAHRQLDKRYADPDEIAGVAAFLLSPDAAFMTGTSVAVDGGYSAW